MNKSTAIIIGVGASAIVGTGIFFAIRAYKKKNPKEKIEDAKKENTKKHEHHEYRNEREEYDRIIRNNDYIPNYSDEIKLDDPEAFRKSYYDWENGGREEWEANGGKYVEYDETESFFETVDKKAKQRLEGYIFGTSEEDLNALNEDFKEAMAEAEYPEDDEEDDYIYPTELEEDDNYYYDPEDDMDDDLGSHDESSFDRVKAEELAAEYESELEAIEKIQNKLNNMDFGGEMMHSNRSSSEMSDEEIELLLNPRNSSVIRNRKPREIDEDEFGNRGYDLVTLEHYADDYIVEDGEELEEAAAVTALGGDIINVINDTRNSGRVIYVRDDATRTDYEIYCLDTNWGGNYDDDYAY